MKRIRHQWLLAALLLCVSSAAFGDKIIESSSRRKPAWLGGMQEGYIIVSAESATLEDAQQKAMTAIREQIVASVATNVHSATSIVLHEVADNGAIQSHREVHSALHVAAADIPYLADVSPTYAEAFYWAKIRREDKSTYYHYHVKYPFSSSRLRLLVSDYEKQQQVLTDSLQALAAVDFAHYDDLSAIEQCYTRLQQLNMSLHADDARHAICDAIRYGYDKMLTSNLHVEVVECTRDATRCRLQYGENIIRHNQPPKVSSNCLIAIEISNKGEEDIIRYDFRTGCYEEEQNRIDITYMVNGKKISVRKVLP